MTRPTAAKGVVAGGLTGIAAVAATGHLLFAFGLFLILLLIVYVLVGFGLQNNDPKDLKK